MKTVWKIADRANDMAPVTLKFDPEALEERQIKRIVKGWEKHGIPRWARQIAERGDKIQSD
jgi:hypothetical protein